MAVFTQVNIIVGDSILADYKNHGSHCIFRNAIEGYVGEFYSELLAQDERE